MSATKLPQRKLGKEGPYVSAIGLGAMGMSAFYGGYNDEQSLKVLTRAADIGSTFWDTSDIYGPHTNELLLGQWFKETGRRNEIFLATKFGFTSIGQSIQIRGDKAYVKEACAGSLERLGVDHIDLYYMHRLDAATCIEETVEAMAELVKEGKVKYLGLSEISSDTLRRAHAIHPISAVQMEYSPFSLDIETLGFLQVARELGVAVVAYSPLGRGFLAGQFKSTDDFDASDLRRIMPRFQGENFTKNLKLVDDLNNFGKKHNATPGQLSLAWLLSQGEDIIPIPGTKKLNYLEENVNAAFLPLTASDLKDLDQLVRSADIAGDRYPDAFKKYSFAESIPDNRQK